MPKGKKRRPPPKGGKRPGASAPPSRPETRPSPVPATAERTEEARQEQRVGGREEARRQRRDEARRRRELAYKRARREAAIRRGVIWGVAGLVVAGLVVLFFIRSQQSQGEVEQANTTAVGFGCAEIQEQPDRGRTHLAPGQTFDYPSEPATSGSHNAQPLPPEPHTYPSPVDETQAVHNLEHAYVLIYYRQDEEQALPAEVVTRLESLANRQRKVIMAPHPELPEGTSLALAAWTRLQTCPSSVTPQQAETVARDFIDLYRGGGSAPEPNAP